MMHDQETEPKDPELRLQVRRFRRQVSERLDYLQKLVRRLEAGEFEECFSGPLDELIGLGCDYFDSKDWAAGEKSAP